MDWIVPLMDAAQATLWGWIEGRSGYVEYIFVFWLTWLLGLDLGSAFTVNMRIEERFMSCDSWDYWAIRVETR